MTEIKTYEYDAEVVRIVDGDTVYLRLTKEYDFGFYFNEVKTVERSFRLINIDTPEIRGKNKSPKGLIAKNRLEEMLTLAPKIRAVTYKPDKYGRWLVELFVVDDDGESWSVNEQLIQEGLAKRYGV